MAKSKLVIEDVKPKDTRDRGVQIQFRISREDDRLLWGAMFKREFRTRAHAAYYYFVLGMREAGDLDAKVADALIEKARAGRHYDKTPTLPETPEESKRRTKKV